jgi:anti-sigma factor RsiW
MKPQLSFESLTSAYLDGTISAEELASLEEILLHDPEARKSFRQIANLDSALRDWAPICAAQAAWADAAPQSVQSRRCLLYTSPSPRDV